MELVPYIGPILGAVPPVLVALFTDPISAVWVALLFIGLQQLEGHVVAPQVFGHTLRINPLLVIFALLLGLQVHGVDRRAVALPILSVLRETVVYLSRHITFEPWDRTAARAVVSEVLRVEALSKSYGELRGASRRQLRGRRRRAARGRSVPTAPARRRCSRSSPGASAPARDRQPAPARSRLGAAAARALLEAHGRREPRAVRAPGGGRRPARGGRRGCSSRPDCADARTSSSGGSPAATASA